MLGYLILFFTIVPIIELAILIKVGQYWGVWNTIAIVILTGVAGAILAKSQGLLTLRRIQEDINAGKMPTERLFDGLLVLLGGVLLLTPGFITDIFGLLTLVPLSRNLIKRWLKQRIKQMLAHGEIITFSSFRRY